MGIVIILLAVLLIIILLPSGKKKRKGKRAVGKIYKTTDGFIGGKPQIKKPRNVAVISQRKDDNAVAVVKIYSKKGKEEKQKEGKTYIPDLILSPKKHKSLTEDSIVGREVFFGAKNQDKQYYYFRENDFEATNDKLTKSELNSIKKGVHNDSSQHRKTYERKLNNWQEHFKNKT